MEDHLQEEVPAPEQPPPGAAFTDATNEEESGQNSTTSPDEDMHGQEEMPPPPPVGDNNESGDKNEEAATLEGLKGNNLGGAGEDDTNTIMNQLKGGNIKGELLSIRTASSVRVVEEDGEEEIELELLRATYKDHAHNPYCPNCNSKITMLILRRDKVIITPPPTPHWLLTSLFRYWAGFLLFIISGHRFITTSFSFITSYARPNVAGHGGIIVFGLDIGSWETYSLNQFTHLWNLSSFFSYWNINVQGRNSIGESSNEKTRLADEANEAKNARKSSNEKMRLADEAKEAKNTRKTGFIKPESKTGGDGDTNIVAADDEKMDKVDEQAKEANNTGKTGPESKAGGGGDTGNIVAAQSSDEKMDRVDEQAKEDANNTQKTAGGAALSPPPAGADPPPPRPSIIVPLTSPEMITPLIYPAIDSSTHVEPPPIAGGNVGGGLSLLVLGLTFLASKLVIWKTNAGRGQGLLSRFKIWISNPKSSKVEESSRGEGGTTSDAAGTHKITGIDHTTILEILKCIVYGGLIESITSLSVVSSVAASDATTLNVLAIGLAIVFSGLIAFGYNLVDLKNDIHSEKKYQELFGSKKHFLFHSTLAILSYLVFGLVAPITYSFAFRDSDNKDYKIIAVATASFACIFILSNAKAYVNKLGYIKTTRYYLIMAVSTSGVAYAIGDFIETIMIKLGSFKSAQQVCFEHGKVSTTPIWAPY